MAWILTFIGHFITNNFPDFAPQVQGALEHGDSVMEL